MIAKPVKNILKRRLLFPLIEFFKQGISPQKLTWTLVLGLIFGVIPFIGINTVILLLLAIIFRLNVIAIQIVNYFVFPLQLILYIPFMKIGHYIFNGPELPYTSSELISMLRESWYNTIVDIWYNNLLGILIWFILSIPVGIMIYKFSLPIFKRYELREILN